LKNSIKSEHRIYQKSRTYDYFILNLTESILEVFIILEEIFNIVDEFSLNNNNTNYKLGSK